MISFKDLAKGARVPGSWGAREQGCKGELGARVQGSKGTETCRLGFHTRPVIIFKDLVEGARVLGSWGIRI